MRDRGKLLSVTVASAATTAGVALAPDLRFAYRSPSLHVALETASALIASLAAFLVSGRFRQHGRVTDLALVFALATLTLTNLGLVLLPPGSGDALRTWASLAGGLAGGILLAAAAWAPETRIGRRDRAARRALAAFLLAVSVVATGVVVLLAPHPTGIPVELAPDAASHPLLVGVPAVLAAQSAAALLFALAAAGFARRADDELMRWVAAGVLLGTFARVNYLLFPSRFSEWVSLGDVFRLASYLVLLVGAAREIRGYWRHLADAAVLEERRRLARDLHDGLAQELAFIGAEGDGAVAAAARRALDESRLAIAALTRPLDEPLELLLAQAAEEVAHRYGARVRCDLEHVEVERPVGDALVRIVREAVSNAARHAGATTIRIELADRALRVVDDGCGFDPAGQRSGFGLVAMRERAAAVGVALGVDAAPGRGVRIEATLP